MTDEELAGIAHQALNMAKTHREQKGSLSIVLGACFDGRLVRLTDIEEKIEQDFGENWMDDARKKDRIFGTIRRMVDFVKPDGMAFVSTANQFVPTPLLFERYPTHEQIKAELDCGHDRHWEMVNEGLLEVRDVLSVTVQTPERVLMGSIEVLKAGYGTLESHVGPQAQLGGRFKMYGEETP